MAGKRKDLLPPCGGCPDRHLACPDSCQKPEYLEYRRLNDLRRKTGRYRAVCDAYDLGFKGRNSKRNK